MSSCTGSPDTVADQINLYRQMLQIRLVFLINYQNFKKKKKIDSFAYPPRRLSTRMHR